MATPGLNSDGKEEAPSREVRTQEVKGPRAVPPDSTLDLGLIISSQLQGLERTSARACLSPCLCLAAPAGGAGFPGSKQPFRGGSPF